MFAFHVIYKVSIKLTRLNSSNCESHCDVTLKPKRTWTEKSGPTLFAMYNFIWFKLKSWQNSKKGVKPIRTRLSSNSFNLTPLHAITVKRYNMWSEVSIHLESSLGQPSKTCSFRSVNSAWRLVIVRYSLMALVLWFNHISTLPRSAT